MDSDSLALQKIERIWKREAYLKKVEKSQNASKIQEKPTGRSKFSLVGDPCITQPGFLETLKRKRSVLNSEIVEEIHSPLSKKRVTKQDPTIVYIVLDDVETIPNHLIPYLSEETQTKIREKRKVKLSEINFEKNQLNLNEWSTHAETKENNRTEVNEFKNIKPFNHIQKNNAIDLTDNENSLNNFPALISEDTDSAFRIKKTTNKSILPLDNKTAAYNKHHSFIAKQKISRDSEHGNVFKRSQTILSSNNLQTDLNPKNNDIFSIVKPKMTSKSSPKKKLNNLPFIEPLKKTDINSIYPNSLPEDKTFNILEDDEDTQEFKNDFNSDEYYIKNLEIDVNTKISDEIIEFPEIENADEGKVGILKTSNPENTNIIPNNTNKKEENSISKKKALDFDSKTYVYNIDHEDEYIFKGPSETTKPENTQNSKQALRTNSDLKSEELTKSESLFGNKLKDAYSNFKINFAKSNEGNTTHSINADPDVKINENKSDVSLISDSKPEIAEHNLKATSTLPFNEILKTSNTTDIKDTEIVKTTISAATNISVSQTTTSNVISSGVIDVFTTNSNNTFGVIEIPEPEKGADTLNSSNTMEIDDEVPNTSAIDSALDFNTINPSFPTMATFPATSNIFSSFPTTTLQSISSNTNIFSFPSIQKSETSIAFTAPNTQNQTTSVIFGAVTSSVAPNIFGGGINTGLNPFSVNSATSSASSSSALQFPLFSSNQSLSSFATNTQSNFSVAANIPKSDPFSGISSLPKPNPFSIQVNPTSTPSINFNSPNPFNIQSSSASSVPTFNLASNNPFKLQTSSSLTSSNIAISQPSIAQFGFPNPLNQNSTQNTLLKPSGSIFDAFKSNQQNTTTSISSPFPSAFPAQSQPSFGFGSSLTTSLPSSQTSSAPFSMPTNSYSSFSAVSSKNEPKSSFSLFSGNPAQSNPLTPNSLFKTNFEPAKSANSQPNFLSAFGSSTSTFGANPLQTSQQSSSSIFGTAMNSQANTPSFGNPPTSQPFGGFGSTNNQGLFSTPVSSGQNPFSQNPFGAFNTANNTAFNTPSQPTPSSNIFGSNAFQIKTEASNSFFNNPSTPFNVSQSNQGGNTFSSLSNPVSFPNTGSQFSAFNFNNNAAASTAANSNPFSFNFQTANNQAQNSTTNQPQNRRFIKARRNFRR